MSNQVTCPKCGNKMSTNRNICPYCGAFMAGTVNGMAMNTAKSYVEEKFHKLPETDGLFSEPTVKDFDKIFSAKVFYLFFEWYV